MENKIETDKIYHVLNKSIAGYQIFNSEEDYTRMVKAVRFFSKKGNLPKFSIFLDSTSVEEDGFQKAMEDRNTEKIVDIIAYCIMPTHFHFILKQNKDNGISSFIGNLLNSYSRYFNTKHKRKGPLWQGRFKRIEIDSDEQLMHLTRYIHLNPTSAGLVKDPEEWKCSSYQEFIQPGKVENSICNYEDLLEINPGGYKKFVDSRVNYQKDLQKIKKRILE